jgi:hypothetical protein
MDEPMRSRPTDQLAGDGWLLSGLVALGQVTYIIDVFEVHSPLGPTFETGVELRVRLLNHSIEPAAYQGRLLTLELHDGRQVTGFISEDGGSLVRTGVLA